MPNTGKLRAIRLLALILVMIGVVLFSACSDDEDDGVSTPQAEATPSPVATIFPASEGSEQQVFFTLSCESATLTITTTLRTIRASLPCDRLPPTQVIERFHEEPTEIEVLPGSPGKIFLRADAAGSLEFTVEDVSVDER
jgi:hypothetical protein